MADSVFVAISDNPDYDHSYSNGNMVIYDHPGFGQHSVYFGDVRMPVAMAKLEIQTVNKNETIDLASGGVITVINEPGLTKYSFELWIPHDQYSMPWAQYDSGFRNPQYFFDYFEMLKTAEQPDDRVFQFMVLEDNPYPILLSTPCTLEDYTIIQDAEQGLDYLVSVVLQTYTPKQSSEFELVGNGDGTYTAVEKDHMSDSIGEPTTDQYKEVIMPNGEVITITYPYVSEGGNKDGITITYPTVSTSVGEATTAMLGRSATVSDAKAVAAYNGVSPIDTIKAGQEVKI